MAAVENENLLLVVDAAASRSQLVASALGARMTSSSAAAAHFSWEIQTKYYCSQVEIRAGALLQFNDAEPVNPELLMLAHAVILSYDGKDAAAVELIKKTAQHMDAIDHRPDVLLVVRVFDPSAVDDQGEHLAAWCNEEGLEHVDFDVSKQVVAAAAPALLQHDDDGDDDVDGLQRIVEALHSTIWPCIARKPAAAGSSASAPVKAEQQQASSDDEVEGFGQEITHCLEDLMRCLDAQKQPSEADSPSFDLGEEEASDPFEKTLRHVAFLREQGAQLPHQQRQKLAEIVALAFAARMGFSDDSDEDD